MTRGFDDDVDAYARDAEMRQGLLQALALGSLLRQMKTDANSDDDEWVYEVSEIIRRSAAIAAASDYAMATGVRGKEGADVPCREDIERELWMTLKNSSMDDNDD